jgi:hypothetical protein
MRMTTSAEDHNEQIVSERKEKEGRIGDSEQQWPQNAQLEQPREQMPENAVHARWMREHEAR